MKKNNRKNKLKAVVAVMLVITSMFTMSSLVNASIIEWILGEEYAEVVSVTSSSSWKSHSGDCVYARDFNQYRTCTKHDITLYKLFCIIGNCTESHWEKCPSCK